MADINSEHYAYPKKKITCPKCGWTGLGKETTEEFDEHPGGMPHYCPKCKSFLARVAWPTDEETLKYGPKKDQEEVRQSNIRMARLRKKWDATKLKSIKQLPEVAGENLEFRVRETRDEDKDTLITITCRDQVVWKEYVYYEYYERLIAIGEMLKEKYGERMTDFVPDDSVDLYGDCLSAPKLVEEFCAGLRTTIPDLEKAIKKNPNDEHLHYSLGLGYGRNGETDKAIEYFNEAIELNPEYAAAYFSRGFSCQLKGDWDKAIADYSRVIDITPKDAAAFSYRGNAQKGKGEYAKALEDYATAMKVDPKYSLVYYDLGNLQSMTGKRSEAIGNFEKYLSMQPTEDDHMIAWAFYSIACIHALEGRTKEALSFFKQALEKGLADRKHIDGDADLDKLRSDPRFIKLIKTHFPTSPDSSKEPPRIQLLDEKRPDGSNLALWAFLDAEAKLHIQGQDLGPVTKSVSGDGEYEYSYTIAAADIPRLLPLLGGRPGDDVLEILKQKWSGEKSYKLGKLLTGSGIPVNLSVYSG